MMDRIRSKLLKTVPRLVDRVRVTGGGPSPRFRGARMEDGSAVPVETVMEQFGVSRARAEEIARGLTR